MSRDPTKSESIASSHMNDSDEVIFFGKNIREVVETIARHL